MILLSEEIVEGKHDKILGVVNLTIYGGMCYTVSGITRKIMEEKEKDTAMIEAIKNSKKEDNKC